MLKVYFRNGINGTREDWTQYLSSMGKIKKRVESEKPGEAGVVVFDKVNLVFEYASGNPVYSKFNIDLTSIQRYIIEIVGLKSTKAEAGNFIGIVDFSTLDWPDDEKKISFSVLDKLSALDLITNTATQRGAAFDYSSRLPEGTDFIRCWDGGTGNSWGQFRTYGDESCIVSYDASEHELAQDQVCVKKGETLRLPTGYDNGLIYSDYIVIDSWIAQMPSQITQIAQLECTWVRLYPADVSDQVTGVVDIPQVVRTGMYAYHSTYYSKPENYIDINSATDAYGKQPLASYDALKIIEIIYSSVWAGENIINRTGASQFPIPVSYYSKLIDENPFGKHPLDALKLLADSMQCYFYTNRSGQLVIQKKGSSLGSNGTTRTISQPLFRGAGSKKYMWDKLVDAVDVTVNSWVKNDKDEFLAGTASVKKYANIKARNSISKEILSIDPNTTTQELLDTYAEIIGNNYFNFYGNRHWAYNLKLNIYDDVFDWDLLDNITINGIQYFFASLSYDLTKRKLDAELVSVTSYYYDFTQAHVSLNDSQSTNYYSTSSASSSSTSGSATVNATLTGLSQLDTTLGIVVQTNDTFFTKRKLTGKENQIKILDLNDDVNETGVTGDFIVSIDPLAKFQAANISIGDVVDPLFALKVTGNSKIIGDLTVDGNIYYTGNINQVDITEMHVADKNIRLNVDGDNTTALGAGVIIEGTNASDLASIKYDGNWTFDKSVNVQTGLGFRVNNNEVINLTTLGSTVLNSSLTKVGIITTGTWHATKVDAQYINYNTTNLRTTSNQLNTIQDIHVSASPQFYQLGLGTAADGVNALKVVGNSVYDGNLSSISPDYQSQVQGWRITNDGQADFRYIYADEMHVKSFIADLEQALAGGQIISKSVAKVAEDFTAASTGSFKVESFAGFPNVDVFQSGDYIRFRIFDRSNGSLTVANVWAVVIGTATYFDSGKTQRWSYSLISGSGNTIHAGALALDYGTSANNWGILEQTTLDGLWGANSPYRQVLIGNPTTGQTVVERSGNLIGINDGYFGTLSGFGYYSQNVYLKGSIYMNGGNITWANTNKPTQNDLGQWTTHITSAGIYTGTITINQLNFVPVQSTDVVAKINASAEGITINTAKLNLTGMLTVGSAAGDINSNTTTVSGNKIRTGVIQSTNYNYNTGSAINLTNSTMIFGGFIAPNFSVDTSGNMTAKLGTIASWSFDSAKLYGNNFYLGGNSADYLSAYSAVNTVVMGEYNSTSKRIVMRGGSTTDYVQMGIASGNPFVQAAATVSGTNSLVTMGYLPSSDYGFSLRNGSTDALKFTKDGLVVQGDVISSRFSTTSTLVNSSAYLGTMIIGSNYYSRKTGTVSNYWTVDLDGEKLWLVEENSSRVQTGRGVTISANGATRQINVDGLNVPKFYGVTNTPSNLNRKAGDYYLSLTGILWMWNGSNWDQLN